MTHSPNQNFRLRRSTSESTRLTKPQIQRPNTALQKIASMPKVSTHQPMSARRNFSEGDMRTLSYLIGLMVIGLFLGSCPPAISWLVIAIIVYAVDAQSWLAWSHVCKKVLEFLPALTDFDATSAIARPFFSFGIFAAEPHCIPNAIFNRTFACSRASMPQSSFPLLSPIDCKAATTLCITGHQAIPKNGDSFSTRTSAFPKRLFMTILTCKG